MPILVGPVIPHGSGVVLIGRLLGNNAAPITQASLSSIAYTVANLDSATIVGAGTFTVADVVFDSLQQADPRWKLDSEAEPGVDDYWGYNFRATLPASLFADTSITAAQVANRTVKYQCDVDFTPASGQAFSASWEWSGLKTWTS